MGFISFPDFIMHLHYLYNETEMNKKNINIFWFYLEIYFHFIYFSAYEIFKFKKNKKKIEYILYEFFI